VGGWAKIMSGTVNRGIEEDSDKDIGGRSQERETIG
jgi:hypothetical protein